MATSYRGSFLAVAGGIYLVGYLVWSFHAWQKHLGLLPALRAQYLLAGLLPLLILIMVLVLASATRFILTDVVPRWEQKARSWVAAGFQLFAALLLILAFRLPWHDGLSHQERFLYWIGVEMLIVLSLSVYFSPHNAVTRFISYALYVWIIPLSIGLAGLVAYLLILYPMIPQELGGVHPKCAKLDLVKREVSPFFLGSLKMSEQTGRIVTTPPLTIYSASGDFIIARNPSSGVVFQLQKDVVQAMTLDEEAGECRESSNLGDLLWRFVP